MSLRRLKSGREVRRWIERSISEQKIGLRRYSQRRPEECPDWRCRSDLASSAFPSQITTSGRIMSCSSCSRMWQCHTYSWPPVRGLDGTVNGTVGQVELHDDRRDLAGVHPHRLLPAELVRIGRRAGPVKLTPAASTSLLTSNGCRPMTCTFTRWKCIGCVSAVSVDDLPDLGRAGADAFRSPGPRTSRPKPALGEPGGTFVPSIWIRRP